MLASNGGRTQLPEYFSGLAGDADNASGTPPIPSVRKIDGPAVVTYRHADADRHRRLSWTAKEDMDADLRRHDGASVARASVFRARYKQKFSILFAILRDRHVVCHVANGFIRIKDFSPETCKSEQARIRVLPSGPLGQRSDSSPLSPVSVRV
jgi:hypothetical protein